MASAITYDANGNISSRTDFKGNVTNYTYDVTRNLETSRTEAYGTVLARTITTTWHSTYRLPTQIDEPGRQTTFTYDTSGNLLSKTITDTALNKSRTWSWTYNSLGQVLTADGPRTDVSDVTTYSYYSSASSTLGTVHSLGDLASITSALGQTTSFTNYDLNGHPLTITDANGTTTSLTYDARGRLKTKTVGTQSTTYDYDGVGQLKKVTLPDASYLVYTYDAAHRLTDIADNQGNKTHYTLDAMGNRTEEKIYDPFSALTKTRSRVFDALNRLQKDIGGTNPSTQITQYGYDNNGNLTSVTDPLSHVTTNGYDALNRLIEITDPANGVTTNGYNALDQLTSVADPRSVVTNYSLNGLGDTTQTQSPDSGTTNTIYDTAGNVVQKTDARGVVANYTYDALNRLTGIAYPGNSAENTTFTYDAITGGNKGKGRLTGYSNISGNTVLTYDDYGNIVARTDTIGAASYTTGFAFDAANRLQSISYPSGRQVIYTRNTLGQITQVDTKTSPTDSAVTLVSNVTYRPFGPITGFTFANGVTTTRDYDADYRVSRITSNTVPVWDFTYTYDAAGNITQQADQIGSFSKTFGYDALDRLTSDANSAGQWIYQYDANGNRNGRTWTHPDTSVTTLNPVIASNSNRMTQLAGVSVTQDAAGNTTAIGANTFSYNQANRMNVVTLNGASAAVRYNALGQRVLLAGAKTKHYVYGPDSKILMTKRLNGDGSNDIRFEYIWLDDVPVAQVFGSYGASGITLKTTYIHADHLNTPRAMTDSTKTVVWRWDGDAFGFIGPNNDPDGNGTSDYLNLRFAGQLADSETGVFYNLNRDYDQSTGRYLQSDPIGLAGGINTYSYVNGNPVSYSDPTGENPIAVGAGAFVVGSAIAVAANSGNPIVQQAIGNIASVISSGGNASTSAPYTHEEEAWALGLSPDPFGGNCAQLEKAIEILKAQIQWRKSDLNPWSPSYLGHKMRVSILERALEKLQKAYRDICGSKCP